MKFFSNVRRNNFDEKSWYSLPPLIQKIVWYRKLSETQKGSRTKFFGTLSQKVSNGKSWYSPHSYPYHFSKPHFLWNKEMFSHEVFRYREITKLRRKIVILPLPLPPLIPKVLRYENFSEAEKGSSKKNFVTVRHKKLELKSWHQPLFFKKVCLYQKVSETRKVFDYEVLRYCEKTNFWLKIAILSLSHLFIQKLFRYETFSETQKGFSTKCFGTVTHQIFDRNSRSLPILHKYSRSPKLSQTQKRSSLKKSSNVRQNNFDGKSWYPPPLLPNKIYRYENFSEAQKDSSKKSFVTVGRKILDRKMWHRLPSYSSSFSMPEIFWNTKGSTTKFLGSAGKQIFDGRTWYSPPLFI